MPGTVSRTEDGAVSCSSWLPLAICSRSLFGYIGGLGRTTQACLLVLPDLATAILAVSSEWPLEVISCFVPASVI